MDADPPFDVRYAANIEHAWEQTLDSSTALTLLREALPELTHRFGVPELALFGSIARGDSDQNSDVDILVKFDGPATSAQYFGVQFHLEDLFGRPVDLVTEVALRPELKRFVELDVLRV